MLAVHPAIALIVALATQTIGISTTTHPTTLSKGTRIACVMQTMLDSSTIQQYQNFVLLVQDPSHPQLQGAEIDGYVDQVERGGGPNATKIGFLLNKIKFANGTKEQIRAFVVSARVTQRVIGQATPQPVAMLPPGQSTTFRPNPNTIAFQTRIGGPKTNPTTTTGGWVYGPSSGKPMIVNQGTAITLELASDLQTP